MTAEHRPDVPGLLEWLRGETAPADPAALDGIAGAAHAYAESREFAPVAEIACRRGCAHCCHLPVEASIAEIARIWAVYVEPLDPTERVALGHRITRSAAAYARARAAGSEPRAPCPLLVDDVCTAYRVRPLACRAWNSLDVSACRAARENPGAEVPVPADARHRGRYLAVATALERRLAAEGWRPTRQLVDALAELDGGNHDDPARWLHEQRATTDPF